MSYGYLYLARYCALKRFVYLVCCEVQPNLLLKRACPELPTKSKSFMNPTKKPSMILQCQEIKHGVVTAMSTITGKNLDCEVISKECKQCVQWMGKERSPEFEEWWKKHQHQCHVNFEGFSGSMDATGLLNIFQRSIKNYGIRYVEFLGDGSLLAAGFFSEGHLDTRAYTSV